MLKFVVFAAIVVCALAQGILESPDLGCRRFKIIRTDLSSPIVERIRDNDAYYIYYVMRIADDYVIMKKAEMVKDTSNPPVVMRRDYKEQSFTLYRCDLKFTASEDKKRDDKCETSYLINDEYTCNDDSVAKTPAEVAAEVNEFFPSFEWTTFDDHCDGEGCIRYVNEKDEYVITDAQGRYVETSINGVIVQISYDDVPDLDVFGITSETCSVEPPVDLCAASSSSSSSLSSSSSFSSSEPAESSSSVPAPVSSSSSEPAESSSSVPAPVSSSSSEPAESSSSVPAPVSSSSSEPAESSSYTPESSSSTSTSSPSSKSDSSKSSATSGTSSSSKPLPPPPSSSTGDADGSKAGMVAGIVVGVVAVAAIAAAAIYCIATAGAKRGKIDSSIYEEDPEFVSMSVL